MALAGDAGARRYFRVPAPSGSVILVLYPSTGSAAQESWRVVGDALSRAGTRVPALLDNDPGLGVALEEDLGDHDLAGELRGASPAERVRLLDEAEGLLQAIRAIDPAAARLNPPFDAAFFCRELSHTKRWLLEAGGTRSLDRSASRDWDVLSASLAGEAADPAAKEPVPTHRDFHANNLLRAPDGQLAVIDFQELRLGPPDYDPVSLRFERAGTLVKDDGSRFREAVLLQRAWKVLGTFEKMLAKGRSIYLPHRDAAIGVIRRHTSRSSPFAPLLRFLPKG